MALSNALFTYLRLERLMMDLDDLEDQNAESIRNLMDPLWYSLSEEDRQYLNSRGVVVDVMTLYPVTLNVPDLLSPFLEGEAPSLKKITPNEDGVGTRFPLETIYCG
jgi:hypothetical protein